MNEGCFEARLHARMCVPARMRVSDCSPEGTETHAGNHVKNRVKYDETHQQVEEHGLWNRDRKNGHYFHNTISKLCS